MKNDGCGSAIAALNKSGKGSDASKGGEMRGKGGAMYKFAGNGKSGRSKYAAAMNHRKKG